MSSRVEPNGSCVLEINCEAAASISTQPAMNGTSFEPSENEESINEDLLQAMQEVNSPVLKLMKLFRLYVGQTTLNCLVQAAVRRRKRSYMYIQRYYCGAVVSGLWFNFVRPLVSIFFRHDVYLLFMFGSWCLLVALIGTTGLMLLPIIDTRKSRFETFLRKAISIHTKRVTLEKAKTKTTTYVMMLFLFSLIAVAAFVITDVILHVNLANIEPWNTWFGFKMTALIFLAYGYAVWLLPLPFFCITCLILEALFDDFYKRIPEMPSSLLISLEKLRREHNTLCRVVELADKILSPLLFEVAALFTPVMCFNFYHVVNLRGEGKFEFLAVNLFWLLTSAVILAAIMIFGSRVNEIINEGNQEHVMLFSL